MKRNMLLALSFTICLLSFSLARAQQNVRDFGAVGDGRHIDSQAINAAIQKAASNGDTVVLPKGIWLCYSLHLESGVKIEIGRASCRERV